MDKLYVSHYNAGLLTQEDIAIAAGLTILQVRQQLYKAGCTLTNEYTDAWANEVHAIPPDGNTIEQARQYIVDLALYNRLKYQVRTTRNMPDRTELKTALLDGSKTQAELAKEFGVSQATVSRHNPKRKTNKQYRARINPTTWQAIQKYLTNNDDNISEAARHFNVSRQSIYRKLNDDN